MKTMFVDTDTQISGFKVTSDFNHGLVFIIKEAISTTVHFYCVFVAFLRKMVSSKEHFLGSHYFLVHAFSGWFFVVVVFCFVFGF